MDCSTFLSSFTQAGRERMDRLPVCLLACATKLICSFLVRSHLAYTSQSFLTMVNVPSSQNVTILLYLPSFHDSSDVARSK